MRAANLALGQRRAWAELKQSHDEEGARSSGRLHGAEEAHADTLLRATRKLLHTICCAPPTARVGPLPGDRVQQRRIRCIAACKSPGRARRGETQSELIRRLHCSTLIYRANNPLLARPLLRGLGPSAWQRPRRERGGLQSRLVAPTNRRRENSGPFCCQINFARTCYCFRVAPNVGGEKAFHWPCSRLQAARKSIAHLPVSTERCSERRHRVYQVSAHNLLLPRPIVVRKNRILQSNSGKARNVLSGNRAQQRDDEVDFWRLCARFRAKLLLLRKIWKKLIRRAN